MKKDWKIRILEYADKNESFKLDDIKNILGENESKIGSSLLKSELDNSPFFRNNGGIENRIYILTFTGKEFLDTRKNTEKQIKQTWVAIWIAIFIGLVSIIFQIIQSYKIQNVEIINQPIKTEITEQN